MPGLPRHLAPAIGPAAWNRQQRLSSRLAARTLHVTTQPQAVNAGATMAAVVVEARRADGQRATTFTGQITLSLTTPGGATLSGTLSVAAVAGVATFSDLAVFGPSATHTLTATANGLASGVSSSFAVTDAAPLLAAAFVSASTEYLSRADEALLSMGDESFTLEAWVYVGAKGGNRGLLGKGDGSLANKVAYLLMFHAASDRFRFVVENGSASGPVLGNQLGAPSLNTWYHLVGVHDHTGNTVKLYINAGTPDSASYSGGSYDETFDLSIGRLSNTANYLTGREGPCRIWRRALTAADITALYNAGDGRSYAGLSATEKGSLVASWELGEASGNRADSHTNGLTLTDNNTVASADGVPV